jgi:hypothetical protein
MLDGVIVRFSRAIRISPSANSIYYFPCPARLRWRLARRLPHPILLTALRAVRVWRAARWENPRWPLGNRDAEKIFFGRALQFLVPLALDTSRFS